MYVGMKTKDFTDNIKEAAQAIRDGGTVAVPTETVYGLAADGISPQAVERLYELKGRPQVKPLSLMVSGAEAMDEFCLDVPPAARMLADCFWPGPLTIVLKANYRVPEIVRAGGDTVGLRCPNHPMTQALLRELDRPLAAPSANPSGEASPTEISQVLSAFEGRIQGYIDGGPCALGLESTVIDLSQTPYRVLRHGAAGERELNMALMASMTIIGITGGTGCGKTTALETIEEMGGLVIDCDALYHELLLNSAPMREEINARFPGALSPGGGDTKALGEIVFSDPEALRELNAITHRFVGEALMSRLMDFAKNGGELAAVDAIALVEGGAASFCKSTVGIIAPTELRIKRLMDRESISREYAQLRIDAQKPNEYFEAVCDHTIMNDGTKEAFAEKCRQLFTDIIRR